MTKNEQADPADRSPSGSQVGDLTRHDRIAAVERELAAMMRDGLASGEGVVVDRRFWTRKKAALRRHT